MNGQEPPKARTARPQQVIAHLQQAMRAMQPGERLPSETTLSQSLGVSRNTVRDALAALERDGLVTRQHGLGTFKAEGAQTLHATLNRVLPIPEVICASGFTPGVLSFAQRAAPADADTGRDLGVGAGTELLHLELLYCADQVPAVLVTYALAPAVAARVRDWTPFDPVSGLVGFLGGVLPHPLGHTATRIAAVSAQAAVAARLQVPAGTALLRFVTLGVSVTGEALYRSVSFQSGELLDVSVERPAVANAAGEETGSPA